MRTREQFKAYVYEKADAEMQRKKRSRNVWIRSVATCSLLLIIGGVMLYSGIGVNDTAMDAAPTAKNKSSEAESYIYYSFDDADGAATEVVEECLPLADDCSYLYASTLSASGSTVLDSFDFSKAEAQYGGTNEGVKGRGFKNITEVAKEDFDLLELAKNECTVEYDAYDIAFDEENEVWRVVFYKSGTVGGDQTVYIGADGKTKLIVYGE